MSSWRSDQTRVLVAVRIYIYIYIYIYIQYIYIYVYYISYAYIYIYIYIYTYTSINSFYSKDAPKPDSGVHLVSILQQDGAGQSSVTTPGPQGRPKSISWSLAATDHIGMSKMVCTPNFLGQTHMPPINAGNSMARWTVFPMKIWDSAGRFRRVMPIGTNTACPKTPGDRQKGLVLKGKWLVLAFGISIFWIFWRQTFLVKLMG